MIIEEQVKDLVVVGEDTSKKAKISQDKLAKLQYLLTKGLYKDPITAVIAEWTNNGIDSVVQAKKDPIENPVLVSIEKDNKGLYKFRVEDKGVGLDDKDFEDICMNYLESTKEEDNDTIGHFGIGMKSFLSLERSATFTCRKNGIERRYLVYEGAEFVNYDLIYEGETVEENGVIAELMINNWFERTQFIDKAKAKLAYYDTAVLLVDGQIMKSEIYRNELFQWSTLQKSSAMHIALKDVYYPIDWEALNIKPIDVPVAIRLNLGDGLKPTPSRESYITNEMTRQLLLGKIRAISDWFVERYNETVKNFKTFLEAHDFLGETNFYVHLANNSFRINSLVPYSDKTVATVKVDGINLRAPIEYKHKRSDLLMEYEAVGYVNSLGVVNTKSGRMGVGKDSHIFNNKGVTVLVGENFRGNIKDYLKEKYGKYTMFVKRNSFEWELDKKEVLPNGQIKVDHTSLKQVLGLTIKPKKEWRGLITEWKFVISTVISTFKDERNIADDPNFLKWLDDKREQQKLKRKLAGLPEYQGLGKKLGDVTLGYSYERHNRIYFRKEAFPIENLGKNKFLTVLLTDDDDIELAKGINIVMKDKLKVRFAHVGKNEIKKVPKHFQFINFQQFMTRDCKPFARFASSLKFKEILKDYDSVQNYKNPIFDNVFKGLSKDIHVLREYVQKNTIYNSSYGNYDKLETAVLDAADKYDLYDKQLWDVYLRVKEQVRKFDFISLMNIPHYPSAEQKERYNTLINQVLLFRKKYYDDLPGAKIVFEKPETKTETNGKLV